MVKKNYLLPIILGIHLLILVFTSFTAWPEMLAWPYLIMKGWLPYRDIAIAHTPFLLFDLSLVYKIFGVGPMQIQIYSWFIALLTDLVIYFVASKLHGKKVALWTLLMFIPLNIFYEGNGLWFDYLLGPLMLLSYYFIKKEKYLTAGLMWGLAFMTKQTAVWFIPAIIYLFWGKQLLFKLKEYACGFLIPITITFVVFQILGILPNFLYWAFQFGVYTLPRAIGQIDYPSFRQVVVSLVPVAMMVPILIAEKQKYLAIIMLGVLGIMGANPRWELFHFQPGLPFIALIGGLVFSRVIKLKGYLRGFFLLAVMGTIVLSAKSISTTFLKEDRFLEKTVIDTAKEINKATDENDSIFVLNSWDSLYALADRTPSVKPLIPQLEWYYTDKIDSYVSAKLLEDLPELVVMQPYTKTGLSAFKPKKVTDVIFKYYSTDQVVDNSYWILKQ